MSGIDLPAGDRTTVLVHYYRAMVGRADIWRMRIDTTTNWAMVSTAGVVSFALGSVAMPHYVLLLAPLLNVFFLFLEARRLTFYHLWQRRVLWLEDAMVRPALRGLAGGPDASDDAALPGGAGSDPVAALDAQLGATIPVMPRRKAAARRLRRIYLYLFAFQVLAWGLKVASHPEAVASIGGFFDRAGVGAVPGEAIFAALLMLLGAAAVLARVEGGPDRRPAAA